MLPIGSKSSTGEVTISQDSSNKITRPRLSSEQLAQLLEPPKTPEDRSHEENVI